MATPSAELSFEYAAFYCEENAFRLVRHQALGDGDAFVVFVTNGNKTVPMMQQRAAPKGGPVVWDYHVVVLTRPSVGAPQFWDLDCCLGLPLPAAKWLGETFPWPSLPPEFEPSFRVVAAADFVAEFSSDRAHMLDDTGAYRAPLPPWPRPGKGPSNLDLYLSIEDALSPQGLAAGELHTLETLRASLIESPLR